MDGTLVDSRRDLTGAVNALLVEHGASPLPEAQVGRMIGDGAATLVARAFEASGIARPGDALDRFLAIYAEHLTDHTRPYDGIVETLAALRERAVLAVLTNKPLAATRTVLERLDLAPYLAPALVIGGDGPFPRKPDPSSLVHLTNVCSVEPAHTLLVGDSLIDWKTARAAATSICLARYGFGYEGFPADNLAAVDVVIDDPRALLRL